MMNEQDFKRLELMLLDLTGQVKTLCVDMKELKALVNRGSVDFGPIDPPPTGKVG